jgi:hypothetical protein
LQTITVDKPTARWIAIPQNNIPTCVPIASIAKTRTRKSAVEIMMAERGFIRKIIGYKFTTMYSHRNPPQNSILMHPTFDKLSSGIFGFVHVFHGFVSVQLRVGGN